MVNNPYASLNQQPQSMNISKSSYLNLKPNTNLPVSQSKPAFVGPELPTSQNIPKSATSTSWWKKATTQPIDLSTSRIFPENTIPGKIESIANAPRQIDKAVNYLAVSGGSAGLELAEDIGKSQSLGELASNIKDSAKNNIAGWLTLGGIGAVLVGSTPLGRSIFTGVGAGIGSSLRGGNSGNGSGSSNVDVNIPETKPPNIVINVPSNQPYPIQNQPITPLYEQSVVPTTPSVDNVPVVPVGTQTISTTKKKRRKAKVKQVPNIRINNVVAGKLLYSRGYLR